MDAEKCFSSADGDGFHPAFMDYKIYGSNSAAFIVPNDHAKYSAKFEPRMIAGTFASFGEKINTFSELDDLPNAKPNPAKYEQFERTKYLISPANREQSGREKR